MLAVKGLDAYYGQSHVLQGVEFEMGAEPVAIIGRNGMGKTTLCKAILGLVAADGDGLGRASAAGAHREAVVPDRRGRPRLRAAGPPALPVALRRRAPAHDQRSNGGGRWTVERDLRAVPAPGRAASRTAPRSSRAASSRCSRSAGRCSRTRSCSSWTSRRRVSRRRSSRGSSRRCRTLVGEGDDPAADRAEPRRRDGVAERQLVMVAGSIFTETTARGAADRPRAAAALPRRHPRRARMMRRRIIRAV